MKVLNIDNEHIVSVKELNQIISYCKSNNDKIIRVKLSKRVEIFDIVFVAGLYLLHRKFEKSFNINLVDKSFYQSSRYFELRQYLMHCVQLYGFEKEVVNIANINLKRSDFKASSSFAPVFFVKEDTIDLFFETNNRLESKNEHLVFLRRRYINIIKGKGNKETEKFFSRRFNNPEEHTLMYIILFCILYKKINPFVNSKKKGINSPVDITKKLLEFAYDLEKGILELAKNIIEHSSTKEGIITLRAYDNLQSEFELGSKNKVVELHVFDFGDSGITDTLIENTKKKLDDVIELSDNRLEKIYKKDLDILTRDFEIEYLIKPDTENQLFQQVYREIAHYGLMKFSRLIEENDGYLTIRTNSEPKPDIYTTDKRGVSKSINHGTSYYFQLPFKNQHFKIVDSMSQNQSTTGSIGDIQGLSQVLSLDVVPSKCIDDSDLSAIAERAVIDFKLEKRVRNRSDESMIISLIKEVRNIISNKNHYFSIDFSKANPSSSSLLTNKRYA